MIPQVILDQFQENPDGYGTAFNYLFDRYSVIGDSELLEGEISYYIPLSREEAKSITPKVVMLDITNVKKSC